MVIQLSLRLEYASCTEVARDWVAIHGQVGMSMSTRCPIGLDEDSPLGGYTREIEVTF